MISCEIKINGQLILYLDLVNRGEVIGTEYKGYYRYNGKLMDIGTGEVTDIEVVHDRDDGAAELIKLALEKAEENKNE